jgi:hypothetical protein
VTVTVPYSAQRVANIVDFIGDPHLLGPSFEGPTWDRWRAVLRAAFALPMTVSDRALFAEVAGDRPPPRRRVKELVCAVGRGGGKDAIAAALATFIATTSDFSRLRPGERASTVCLATDRSQAGIAFNYARALLEETPLLAPLIARIKGERILLRNGAEILVTTNNIRSPRGRTIACAIFDECAHWFGEDYANPDAAVDAAVTPGLMRFPGSLKIIISSVHRRAGLLHDKVTQSFGRDDDDTLVVVGSSLQFNPTLDAAEIDRQLALDPEAAGAEYLSRWRDDLTNFLDRQLVEAAIEKGVVIRPPQPHTNYTCFCDPSGGRGDSFTLAIGHREGTLCVIDLVYEKRAPFDGDATVTEVADLVRSYGATTLRGDSYGADLIAGAFRRRGVTYRALTLPDAEGRRGKLSASEIYVSAVGLFTSGRAKLPDNPRLVHQLISLERRTSRGGGHDTVDHPPGGHDDLANSACGCLVALAGRPAPVVLSPATLAHGLARLPQRDRFARSTRDFSPRQLGFR